MQADASFPSAHRELGKALLGENNNADGERELQLAIRDNPEDGDAYYYLGAILVQTDHYQEGIPYLQKATSLMPGRMGHLFLRWEKRSCCSATRMRPRRCCAKPRK